MYDSLLSGEGSVQDQIREAINSFLSKRERSGYREVVLSPRGTVNVDQMLEWLAARAPLLRDLQGNNGKIHRSIHRPMRRCLSDVQLRRMTRWVEGDNISVIGRSEGVSKQAIHASIQRSIRTLGEDQGFVFGLCELFPDSGLTPEALMTALQENRNVGKE